MVSEERLPRARDFDQDTGEQFRFGQDQEKSENYWAACLHDCSSAPPVIYRRLQHRRRRRESGGCLGFVQRVVVGCAGKK